MSAWITVPYVWHTTAFEALWLAAGLASAVLTVMNLYDSWKDKAALEVLRLDPTIHDRHYRMVEVAAKGRSSSQFARLRISLYIVAIGIYGVLTSNPLGGKTTLTGLVITLGLISIAVETAVRSWRDLVQRNLLYEMATKRTAVLAAQLRVSNPTIETEEP